MHAEHVPGEAVVGVPLAPRRVPYARVPFHVGADLAVALARDEVPHALAEPGVVHPFLIDFHFWWICIFVRSKYQ